MVIKQCTGNTIRTLICLRRDEDDKQKEEQKEEFRGRCEVVQRWRRRVINKIHSIHVSIYQNTLFKFKNLAKRFWWWTALAGVWFWNLPLYFKYEIKLFDRFFSTLSIFFSYALHSSTCFLSHFVRKGMFGNFTSLFFLISLSAFSFCLSKLYQWILQATFDRTVQREITSKYK